MKNYYAILEVPAGAGLEEIRQAYHRLTQEHLDDDGAFADLKEAFEVLTSPAGREAYDRTLIGGAAIPSVAGRGGQCPLQAGAQCPVLNGQVTASDTFCPECGYLLSGLNAGAAFEASLSVDPSAMARLEGADGQVHLLQPGLNIIGRENADVLLSDKTVSRQHARLELGDTGLRDTGLVTLEDLGSTNGTQVNEVPLVPPVQRRLAAGDRLRFGSVMTTLYLPAPTVAADRETSLPAEIPTSEIPMTEMPNLPLVPPAQVVDIRAGFGQIYPLLPSVTTFGRRAENTVVLTGDQYVSGSHARITFLENHYVLTDTGSTNGTLLNGDRLAANAPAELTHGDVILIGAAALRFEIIGMPLEDEIVEEIVEQSDSEELNSEELDSEQAELGEDEAVKPVDISSAR